ncbi:hypothetical protein DXG01_016097 [Tephrocybe rancida]|nr:hypothetical protein DXG01_016097 [Tephrocybe rancida]
MSSLTPIDTRDNLASFDMWDFVAGVQATNLNTPTSDIDIPNLNSNTPGSDIDIPDLNLNTPVSDIDTPNLFSDAELAKDASVPKLSEDEPEPAVDVDYYMDTVIFKVEDTLYKVAKYHFLRSTDFFAQKFALCMDNDIVYLSDATKDEFRALLRLMYPLSIGLVQIFSTEEWVAILKLSTQWKMLEIRNMAIHHLTLATIPVADRIAFAQKYDVSNWLRSALITLVHRNESISIDEAEKIGLELSLKICRMRDSSRILPDALDNAQLRSITGAEFQKELQLLPPLPAAQRVVRAVQWGALELLRDTYVELVERPDLITDEEVTTLGWETTARISRARERRLKQLSTTPIIDAILADRQLQSQLGEMTSLSPVQRVVMSRNNVAEWLLNSLAETAQQRDFSIEEVNNLGTETVIRLYRVREAMSATCGGTWTRADCRMEVSAGFVTELRMAQVKAKQYRGTGEMKEEDAPGNFAEQIQESEVAPAILPHSTLSIEETPASARGPCPSAKNSHKKKKKTLPPCLNGYRLL